MTLYLIGLGLSGVKDISVKGLEIVKQCDLVYIENYTSLLQCSLHDLAKYYNKELIVADRNTTEQGDEKIIEEARNKDVAFLVIGDKVSKIEGGKLMDSDNNELNNILASYKGGRIVLDDEVMKALKKEYGSFSVSL